MRILITNDDGIGAPGIRRLAEMAASLGEVWVVAPENQCSAMSHRITIRGQMTARRVDFPVPAASAWSLAGTPADCVKVALMYLMRDHRPDMVFSGVNHGYNAGYDIAYSGTVGAAMEAMMQGVPAMAWSTEAVDCHEVEDRYMREIAAELLAKKAPEGGIWNVNFPGCALADCRGIRWDTTVAPIQVFKESYSPNLTDDGEVLTIGATKTVSSETPEGTDLRAVLENYISVGIVKSSVL